MHHDRSNQLYASKCKSDFDLFHLKKYNTFVIYHDALCTFKLEIMSFFFFLVIKSEIMLYAMKLFTKSISQKKINGEDGV